MVIVPIYTHYLPTYTIYINEKKELRNNNKSSSDRLRTQNRKTAVRIKYLQDELTKQAKKSKYTIYHIQNIYNTKHHIIDTISSLLLLKQKGESE